MPSAVKAIFSADSVEYEKAMGRMVVITNAATKQMAERVKRANMLTSPVEAEAAGATTAQSFARGWRGFFQRSRVASSMFVSVARDSAASLASGAPISQVIAQQAPQVLQAFTFMGISIKALGIGAIGAAAMLLTLKKAGEAYAAKQEEMQSRADLALTQSSNRMRLVDLLEQNKKRLNPGEADALRGKLFQAISANERGEPGLRTIEAKIRARLREVHVTEDQKKKLKEIGEIAAQAHMDQLEGKNKERAQEMANYNKRKAEIEELSRAAKTPQDHELVRLAYQEARLAHEKKMRGINNSDAIPFFKPEVTERMRIGGGAMSSLSVSLLDSSKKTAEHADAIRKILERGRIDGDGSF